jgi:hypothetical protein
LKQRANQLTWVLHLRSRASKTIFSSFENLVLSGTRDVKKKNYWLTWLRVMNSKGHSQNSKHHLHVNGVHLIAFECHRSNHMVILSLFSLSLLTFYEWHDYHWQNDTTIFFLCSSNHAVILSLLDLFLFFLSLMSSSHQLIFLYFVHQYFFPFEFLGIFFWVMLSIMPINVSFPKKRMKKGNNNHDWRGRVGWVRVGR